MMVAFLFELMIGVGVLILNIVTRTDEALEKVLEVLKKNFDSVVTFLVGEEENTLAIAFKSSKEQSVNIDVVNIMKMAVLTEVNKNQIFKDTLSSMIKTKTILWFERSLIYILERIWFKLNVLSIYNFKWKIIVCYYWMNTFINLTRIKLRLC